MKPLEPDVGFVTAQTLDREASYFEAMDLTAAKALEQVFVPICCFEMAVKLPDCVWIFAIVLPALVIIVCTPSQLAGLPYC